MTPTEGLYPIPQGWVLYSVDQIKAKEHSACVAGPFGSKISSKYFVNEGVPVIRGGNLRDDLTRFISTGFVFVSEDRALQYRPQHVKGGDLVFTCWGTIGQVGLIPDDGPYPEYVISNKQLKLRVDRSMAEPLFCFYYLASPAGVTYIRNRGIGGAIPGINLGILKSLPIALPPLEAQQRIIEILSAYDDLIENNRRRMALLEESARLLYREWFVGFRFPGHEHTPVVDGVPEGWEQKRLGEYVTLNYGKTLTADVRVNGPFPVFGSSGIVGSHDKALAQGPGIIVGRKGNVGSVFWSNRDFYAIDTVYYTNSDLSDLYLFYALRHMHFISTDVAVPGLNRDLAYSRPLLLPTKNLVQQFLDAVIPVYEQLDKLDSINQKLRAARDLLLPRLMSGEITV